MSSSPWPPAAGAAPPTEAAPASASASASDPPLEQQPVKEEGDAAAAAVLEETKPGLPLDDDIQIEIQEHEQKINKYQAILAARLKAKYFSNKAFDGGNVFEELTDFEGETIQSSRWPCTGSFADPAKFFRDKNSCEKNNSPSLTADSPAKNNPSSVAAEASAKNNTTSLSAENSLAPSKRQPSKKT